MFAKGGPTFFELMHQALCSTQRGYDLLAPKFDKTPFRTPDAMLEAAIRAIASADAALDVCCGTGAAMRHLRPVCRHRIVGIDFSAGMIEQARLKLSNCEGTARVEFVEADVMQMSFQNEFDLVTCFGGLGHILPRQKSAFLGLIHRALKPGGRFVFYSAYPPPLFSVSNIARRSFNTVMKIRNALLHPPFIMYYFTFLMPEIADELSAAGFTVEFRPEVYREYGLVIATK